MASTSTSLPRFRFVKCPKCSKLLMEFADVPVYKCGQCGTILKAKVRVQEGLSSGSEGNNSENMLDNSLNREATSFACHSVQSAASSDLHVSESINASNSEVKGVSLDGLEKEAGVRSSGNSIPTAQFSHGGGEISNLSPTANVSHERGEMRDEEKSKSEEKIQAKQGEYSMDERMENLDKLSSSSKKDQSSSESTDKNPALQEENTNLATGSSNSYANSYDGSVSSSDRSRENGIPHKYMLKSRRTFRRKKSADSITATENEMQAQGQNIPDNRPLNERFEDSAVKDSCNSSIAELHHNLTINGLERDTTLGSEDFYSLQNLIGSESDAETLNSLPEDLDPINARTSKPPAMIGCLEPEHMKILRKVDELKDELSEFLVKAAGDKGISPRKTRFTKIPRSIYNNVNPNANFNLPTYAPEARTEEKKAAIKSYCRPVCSGAPFVVCYRCWNLLQLPADFLVTRKRLHKLRCGACSHVLAFSFRPRDRTSPTTPTEIQHPPSEVDGSNGRARWDPVSYSDDYMISFAQTVSSEVEPVNVSSCSSCKDHPTLHRLMGYYSAREILLRPHSVDEGYQSTEPSTPQFYRPTEDDTIYRMSDRVSITPNSEIEEEEEEEPDERLRTRRRSAIQGLLKKGVRELSHGFESMKLKFHASG